jgi:hypothetical protein
MGCEEEDTPLKAGIRKMLHHLKLHIQNGWEHYHVKINKGQTTVAKARTDFFKVFGTSPKIFTF